MLVHLIDNMDSKMNGFRTAQKNDNNQGQWTSYIKHLDRILYKSELPFFPEKIKKNTSSKSSNELKQNMGDALKGFKVTK